MRSYRSKNQFFAMFLLGGFLIGILYTNLISDKIGRAAEFSMTVS